MEWLNSNRQIMSPQDPHQLLTALAPLLAHNGGIKGTEEAIRISSLMKDSVKKVARCIYVSILKCTQSEDALAKVLDCGGWATLNSWLQECKDEDNVPLLIELLKLYQNLPVTIDILKKNNAAKIIKQLSKSEDEKVRILSSNIVESWMKKIRGRNSNGDNENDKMKKKKKDKHKDNKEKDSAKDKKDVKHHHNKDGTTTTSADASDRLAAAPSVKSDSKSVKEDSNTDIIRKRPKTVKTFPSKFRSTGIGEEMPTIPVRKKITEPNNKIPLLKRSVQEIKSEDLPEKKPRLLLNMPVPSIPSAISRTNTSPTEIHGRIKLIAPKKPPEFQESSGFMDSLITKKPTGYAIKRKKKFSPGKLSGAPTSPTSPTSSISPTTPVPPSPTTAMAQRLPSVPSFYKDTLDTSDEQIKEEKRSPSPEEMDETTSRQNGDDVEAMDAEEDNGNEAEADQLEDLPEYSTQEPKSVLTTGSTKRKKAKKKVSWEDDSRIKQIFYFEMDETERENVNRPKDSFNLLKKQEMMMDRKAMESAKRLGNDNMAEALQWMHPAVFDDAPTFVRGTNSVEKDIQKAREQKVLQSIFFAKTMLPDTPVEPDLESIEPSQPKVIPLEDENAGEELTYTYDNIQPQSVVQPPQDPNQFNLPPELASIITAFQQQLQHEPHSQNAINPAVANIQHIISSYLSNSERQPELAENLWRALEPFRQQFAEQGFSPDFMQGFGNPMPQLGIRQGLLGLAPPGFQPMGGQGPPAMMPPRFQGPPGPDSDEWGENMMGGPRHGPPGGQPMHGGPPMMMGPGGPPPFFQGGGPPRGPPPPRHMMRGGGGRGGRGMRGRPVCRHFIQPGGCRFGKTCSFLHPGPNS